jgi:type VI secretion system VgrG family protein
MAAIDDKLGPQKRFGFSSSALPAGTFAVVSLSGSEAISKPYEFELALISENSRIDLQKVIEQPATLTIHPRGRGQAPVVYHGLVKEFDQAYQVDRYTFYRALLAPRLWDLSLDKISEVYLDQTIPQMIEKELQGNGMSSQDYALQLSGSYKPWPYFCQYQENDLDFITRIMEREGIYYYFEQGKDREKLIVTDNRSFHQAEARNAHYRPAAQLDTGLKEDAIRTWLCKQRPVPQKVVLQDYNEETAAIALMAEAEVAQDGKGEVRIYNENFRVQGEGKRLAQIRAEELLSRRKVFHGEGSATGLQAGFFMQLQGHYRPDFNGKYLVTEVRHEGSQRGVLLAGLDLPGEATPRPSEDFYRSECTAIPADVQFRPERTTPRPLIHGTMTAFVDAEGSGQYAELDPHGRYKVQLPFDKTDKGPDKASAWIRKATPYSGKDHGMHFPLHKGAEVLLSFVDGDPNQPIIVGAVPNSENRNLVTRQNQTQSVLQTAGNNMLLMEDKEGSERIYLSTPKSQTHLRMGAAVAEGETGQAGQCQQGDEEINGLCFETEDHMYTEVGQNSIEIIHGDCTETIGGNAIETVGGYSTETVQGDMSETINGNFRETIRGTSFSMIMGGYNGELVLGADTYLVVGPRVDTALGVSMDLFLGLWTLEFSTGVSTEVHNLHVNATDTDIQALQTRLRAVQSSLAATQSDISAVESRVGVTETVLEAHGQDIRVAEMAIHTQGQRIATAETNITTNATDIRSCESSIHNAFVAINDHETLLSNAGITILS